MVVITDSYLNGFNSSDDTIFLVLFVPHNFGIKLQDRFKSSVGWFWHGLLEVRKWWTTQKPVWKDYSW